MPIFVANEHRITFRKLIDMKRLYTALMTVAIVASSVRKILAEARHSGCGGGYSRRFQLENDPGRERFGLGSRRGRNDAFVCRDPHLLLADPFGGELVARGVAKSAGAFPVGVYAARRD